MARSCPALQSVYCTHAQGSVQGFSSARGPVIFLAALQCPNRVCSSRSAKCFRREALAGLAFGWPRLSTQHHNPGKEEEKGRTSFPPGVFFWARRLSASLLSARLQGACWYLEARRRRQRAPPSDGAVQAGKERRVPLECAANPSFHASGASSGEAR